MPPRPAALARPLHARRDAAAEFRNSVEAAGGRWVFQQEVHSMARDGRNTVRMAAAAVLVATVAWPAAPRTMAAGETNRPASASGPARPPAAASGPGQSAPPAKAPAAAPAPAGGAKPAAKPHPPATPAKAAPGAAGASTFAPPRQPTTKPTTKPADTFGADSPKAAVKQFFDAYATGDGATLRSIIQASDPTEQRFLDAMVRTSEAQRRVREAAAKRFSKDAAEALTILAPLPPGTLEQAAEKVKGDTATVTLSGTQQAIVLRRQTGRWRLAVFGMMQQQQMSQDIEKTVADMNELAGKLEKVAGEIAAGQYKIVPEAKAAWLQAMGMPVPPDTKRAIQMASATAAEENPKSENRNPKEIQKGERRK